MDREGVWVRGACTGRGMHWEGMHGMEEVPAPGGFTPPGVIRPKSLLPSWSGISHRSPGHS